MSVEIYTNLTQMNEWGHISNIKSFLPVEAEISVKKVFITANMKNSKSRGQQEVDER
jgi:hypothetical protein